VPHHLHWSAACVTVDGILLLLSFATKQLTKPSREAMLNALMWWPLCPTLFEPSFVSGAFVVALMRAKQIPERLGLKLIATDSTRSNRVFLPWFWFLFPLPAQFTIPQFIVFSAALLGAKLQLGEYNMSRAYDAIALNWWRFNLYITCPKTSA
jgi:hypothetical protein